MNNTSYESTDFYASAYLIASGIPMRSNFRTGQITTFVFDDSDQVQDLLNSYYSMQANVNPATYASALKNLKSIIHGTYKNTNHNKYHEQSQERAF